MQNLSNIVQNPTSAAPSPSTSLPATSSPGIKLWLWRWFWRITLVVSLGYAWYCYYVPTNEIDWAVDYQTAKQVAAETGKPMILYATGTWCVPCRIMKRTVWADAEVESIVNAGFVPVMIDVGSDTTLETRQQYEVHYPPTTIVASASGEVLARADGSLNKSEFLSLLETAGE